MLRQSNGAPRKYTLKQQSIYHEADALDNAVKEGTIETENPGVDINVKCNTPLKHIKVPFAASLKDCVHNTREFSKALHKKLTGRQDKTATRGLVSTPIKGRINGLR